MLILYDHQKNVLELNPACYGLFHSTGTGKTVTAISLANKNCKSCIVIVPKVIEKQWLRECEKYADGNCKFTVITKEQFKKHVKELPKFDGEIIDEGHYFANRSSQLSKALRWYNKEHDVKFRWICTATPVLSTPLNVYALAEHLGHKWDYWTFFNDFFTKVQMGARSVPVAKKNMEAKLQKLVNAIGSVVDLKEVVDVPDQTYNVEYFDLSHEQLEAIKSLQDSAFITRWTHRHQIENGILYGDEYRIPETFPCAKNDRILEICKSSPKVAIFCRYNGQITFLAGMLIGMGYTVSILNGETKDKDGMIQSIEKAERGVILIQAQCSAGYELPSIDTVIFASLSFSFVDYQQAIGRFLRINKLKKNTYYILVSRGVDQDVWNCISNKKDFYIDLYNK